MAAADSMLFRVDQIVVDGKPVAFEDGSAMLSGAAGYENEIVVSASGPDFARRKRVPRVLKLNLQFSNATDPAQLAKAQGVQITLRDSQAGRRCIANNCQFGSMGDIGGGTVPITYNVLSPLQWL